MKKVIGFLALLAFAGCSATSQLASLETPTVVGGEITLAGAGVAAAIPAADKAVVHQYASALLAVTTDQLTSAQLTAILPAVSAAAQPYVNPLINAGTQIINAALAKFGEHNATTVAYVQAVGAGLLQAGF